MNQTTLVKPPTREWPAIGRFGCSRCGATTAATNRPHWCEPEKDWSYTWDRLVKYVAEGDRKRA